MADTFTTKLGTTSKAGSNTRIWLEGKRLSAHGFTPGMRFSRTWARRELTLRVITEAQFAELARDAKGTVSGKGEKPIIDVVGAKVREVFGHRDDVSVTFQQGRITIKG